MVVPFRLFELMCFLLYGLLGYLAVLLDKLNPKCFYLHVANCKPKGETKHEQTRTEAIPSNPNNNITSHARHLGFLKHYTTG